MGDERLELIKSLHNNIYLNNEKLDTAGMSEEDILFLNELVEGYYEHAFSTMHWGTFSIAKELQEYYNISY